MFLSLSHEPGREDIREPSSRAMCNSTHTRRSLDVCIGLLDPIRGEKETMNRLFRGLAFLGAVGAATGTALVTSEFARQQHMLHASPLKRARHRLGFEEAQGTHLAIAAAAGAAVGLVTYGAMHAIIGRANRAIEETEE